MSSGSVPTGRSGMSDLMAYGLLLIAALSLSTNVVFGRGATDTVPPVALAFWRWVVASAILLPLTARALIRHRDEIRRRWRMLLLQGALGMGVCGAFVYIGLADTTAMNGSLIYTASPVMIILIGALFQSEVITPRQIVGILLALVGVATILTQGRPQAILSLDFNIGDLWILCATLSWAVYSVILRYSRISMPVLPFFAAMSLAGVIVLAPFYVVETIWIETMVVTWPAVWSILAVALIPSVIAFSTYQKGIAVVGSNRAGPFLYLMPVFATLLAVTWLGEQLHVYHVVGFLLVIPGVAAATLASQR